METNNIIQEGTLSKFKLSFNDTGFDPTTMDFEVELLWGYRQKKKTIPKANMIEADGGWLFELDTTGIIGKVKARCTMVYLDTDVNNSKRPEVDDQWLCFVTSNPCPNIVCCHTCKTDHPVTYTRIDESDISDDNL